MTRHRKKGGDGTHPCAIDIESCVLVHKDDSFLTFIHSYAPDPIVAFYVLVFMRVLASFVNLSLAYDEVYNHWESLHHLLYGYGFRPWEYSLGTRSTALLSWETILGKILVLQPLITIDKIKVFYLLRFTRGLISAGSEALFYAAVRNRLGKAVAFYQLLYSLFNPGLFLTSSSCLEWWVASHLVLCSVSCWLRGRFFLAVALSVAAVLFGPSMVMVLVLPLLCHAFIKIGIIRMLPWLLFCFFFILGLSVGLDSLIYGDWVGTWWRRMAHECFMLATGISIKGGQYAYGPGFLSRAQELGRWSPQRLWQESYLLNKFFIAGVIDFNIVFVAALLSPIALFFLHKCGDFASLRTMNPVKVGLYLSPVFFFVSALLFLPASEERLVWLIYPQICFCAAITTCICLSALRNYFASSNSQFYIKNQHLCLVIVWCFVLLYLMLSMSRLIGIMTNDVGPVHIYSNLYRSELKNGRDAHHPIRGQVYICVEHEWSRFPSHFFIPSTPLPRNVTQDSPHQEKYLFRFMNNSNSLARGPLLEELPYSIHGDKEVPLSRMDRKDCHYVIEQQFSEEGSMVLHPFSVVRKYRYLDKERSHALLGEFWIPFVSEKFRIYNNLFLLKNVGLIFRTNRFKNEEQTTT